jgi:hypothetical protein
MPKRMFLNEGDVFNFLTVIKEIEPHIYKSGRLERRIECRCICGRIISVLMCNLTSNHSKSCGCEKGDTGKNFFKHGLCKTSIHSVYRGMIARCYNKGSEFYNRYGGRGITICDEWRNNFISFYEWSLSNGYKKWLEIDRYPNNDGNYEPSNCRWATKMENCNNRCNSLFFYIGNEKMTLRDICDRYKLKRATVYMRLFRSKMSILDAIKQGNYKTGIK